MGITTEVQIYYGLWYKSLSHLHLHMDGDISNGFQVNLSQDTAGLIMALGDPPPPPPPPPPHPEGSSSLHHRSG